MLNDAHSSEMFDLEADVVIVGYGGAGAAAAITASDAGAETIILEKEPEDKHTPSTMMSAAGIHMADNQEEAARYFQAVAFGIGLPAGFGDPAHIYPQYPRRLAEEHVRVWAEGVTQTRSFVQSLDSQVKLEDTFPGPAFPEFPGAQHYGTFAVVGGGMALFKVLYKAVQQRGVEVCWETPAARLIVKRGEVIGVTAKRQGNSVNIKARRGVILASGGFEFDDELKTAFLPGWGWTFMGNPGNTGDGIRMGMGAGAALGHMSHTAARVVAGGIIAKEAGTGIMAPLGQPGRILVDNYGHRYIDESLSMKDPERYFFYKQVITYDISKLEYPRIPSWFIFDEKVRQKGPVISTFYGAHAAGIYKWSEDNLHEINKGWIIKGENIHDLAARIAAHPDNKGRMNADILAGTISKFNQYSEAGVDPEYSRPENSLGKLEKPPFYAIAEYPGGPNTEGGLIRNGKSQVMSIFGNKIPRLYAAGEVASIWSFLYQGGGNLAECLISGRAAGSYAAAEKPWTENGSY